MTETAYLYAWGVYLAGSLCLVLVLWRLLRSAAHWVKYPLLFLALGLLVAPFSIETGSPYLAPATLILLFEGIFVPESGFVRAGPTVAVVSLISVLAYPLLFVLSKLIGFSLGSRSTEEVSRTEPEI
ncbi:hypothetical protein [Marinibactrum halimedae]|uniref:Uncharacterized protein n=1 Tax=Marinibactrum halimedae TaxID=1444977 RepID=A0AA37TA98_9GAMM|nr:hypothetical protein [Marinibactrum halimedae]MCD9457874.1 hypothetical protein [Marinibactrum halimedae]GLS26305.1 hypothetical protein GCM10007877_20200 [Marinibactrum halimedae]